MDFIRKYNCILDYSGNDTVIIIRDPNFHEPFALKLMNAPNINSISLPARSEVIRVIKLASNDKEVLVPHQMLQDGVFIASTITTTANPLVRIINTTNENVILSNLDVQTESLNDYEMIHMAKNDKNNKEKLKKLSKNFPSFVKDNLNSLCSEFIDIFGLETEKISVNNFYKQKLKLNDKSPVYIKNYRTPNSQKEEINKNIDKLIDHDIVEPSVSDYNSPILLVPKKPLPGTTEKRWRLVIDYRGINKKLIADKFPLPRMDDILDQLGRAKYFSCLDLISGFHQIELDEDSRDITSFSTTEKGAFRFKRLPYGIKIAPNSFQRMMSIAFSGLSPAQAFLYMDDLIVIGCSVNHMINNLKSVFNLCRKHNLKLHPEKCSFFATQVTFLGHKCTDKGILPDDSKFSVIKNYPTPTNGDEAKRFVAFCNYYRRFIPNFAEYARHITHLSKKNVAFNWTPECENSFLYLKNQLLSPKILQYPDFSKQFCITTDASKKACGAVLSQEFQGIQLPVAYASRSFTKGESNKSTIEQELAAIHWAIQYFKPYVYGTKFLIRSDHKPLTYLFALKQPSSKLTRMRLDLEEYDFVIEYIRGRENYAADALSRIEFSDIRNTEINKILTVTTRLQSKQKDSKATEKTDITEDVKVYETINAQEYSKMPRMYFANDKIVIKKGKKILFNKEFQNLITNGKIDLGQFFPKLEKVASNLDISTLQLSLEDNLLKMVHPLIFKETGNEILKNLKIVLTPILKRITSVSEKEQILKQYHNCPIQGGHTGITRMFAKIKQKYFWPKMKKEISQYVKNCKDCQLSKIGIKTKEPFIITPTPIKAFDIVVIDTIGPLPRSEYNNEYAVTIICDLTKYLVAIPIENKSAKTVAKAIMEEFILIYGPMSKILTDMGTEYMNQVLQELCTLMKIEKLNSTPYHHETLGTVERSHRTLNEYLRTYISSDKSDWDIWSKFFVYCYNTTPSTTHGYCPFELVFGKLPPVLDFTSHNEIDPLYNIDSYQKEVKFRLQVAQRRASEFLKNAKMERKIISENVSHQTEIKINDLVLVRDEASHKLSKLFRGPFKVIEIDDKSNIKISDDNDKSSWVHKNRTKIFNK